MQKLGRNAPCPCGSGKKKKNCLHKENAIQVQGKASNLERFKNLDPEEITEEIRKKVDLLHEAINNDMYHQMANRIVEASFLQNSRQ